jgi:hypothetical protein
MTSGVSEHGQGPNLASLVFWRSAWVMKHFIYLELLNMFGPFLSLTLCLSSEIMIMAVGEW